MGPLNILDIPRIVSTKDDVAKILNRFSSKSSGLTLCVGSFASMQDNDVYDITSLFADRVQFVHLRNVHKNGRYSFVESNHLNGDVNMYKIIKIMMMEVKKRMNDSQRNDDVICMRPDHGHFILDDLKNDKRVNPGYPLYVDLKDCVN